MAISNFIPIPFRDYAPITIVSDLSWEDLPTGWLPLYDEIWRFVEILQLASDGIEEWSLTVRIDKGLLRFELTGGLDDSKTSELDRKLINRMSQSIASASSKLCLICGKHGFRRKNEQGWPCLCSQHYIEFLTELTANENGTDL